MFFITAVHFLHCTKQFYDKATKTWVKKN